MNNEWLISSHIARAARTVVYSPQALYSFPEFWNHIVKVSLLMLRLSSLNTSECRLKDRSAAMLLHGTLKHISAMSDSFWNCCAAKGWGVALRSPTLDRDVCSSVFACMSFSQINSWVMIRSMIQKFAAGEQVRVSCDCREKFTPLTIT